jgi:pimeloyl-ACP methyl ester carboxylesterase
MSGYGPERTAAWIGAWERVVGKGLSRGYASLDEAAAALRKNDKLLKPELARWMAERGTRHDPDGRFRFKHDPLHLTPGPIGFQVEIAQRFWQRVTCPVLLVDGAESEFRHFLPEELLRRQATFPDARAVVLPGAGHTMQRHQPEALARLLVEFLSPA